MLAVVGSQNWQAFASIALLLMIFYLSTRREWMESSVRRLVLVRVHFKDGANRDIISFPWRLRQLFNALEKNPLERELPEYLRSKLWYCRSFPRKIERIDLYRVSTDRSWGDESSIHDHFRLKKTLWSKGVRYWTGK